MLSDTELTDMSLLDWMFSALGPVYLTLLPLAAMGSFVLALVLVIRGKGTMAAAALILVVHVPLLIGIFAALQGIISSFSVIALGGATVTLSDMSVGISTSLFAPLCGMILMVPGYLAATIGASTRALRSANESKASNT